MDRLEQLIQAYWSSQPTASHEGMCAERVKAVLEIGNSTDPRRVPFLLDILRSEVDCPFARVEAIKMLRDMEHTDEQREDASGILLSVLESDSDSLVRTYAAMAMGSLPASAELIDGLGSVVRDDRGNKNLRHAAFGALQELCTSGSTVEIMKDLTLDDEFKHAASRVLSQWHRR